VAPAAALRRRGEPPRSDPESYTRYRTTVPEAGSPGAAHDSSPAQSEPALRIGDSRLHRPAPRDQLHPGKVGGDRPREHGSKNLGATNVYRILGWKYAIPVALFDIAKARYRAVLRPVGGSTEHLWLPVALGGAAVLGHMFSPYVSFKAAKASRRPAGMFLALAPVAVLLAILVWDLPLADRYVSLSSILASPVCPCGCS